MNGLLVMQSDFGLSDGAVSAMCGVVLSVDDKLRIYHLTHDIPPFDTFEASYRLMQAVPFWPEGTVFVTVVDPGVGSSRKNIVAKTKRGQYIVTPDNGSLSHISRAVGIESVRVISERIGRRQNSEQSYTFLGRDLFSYTAALLASGKVSYEEIGEEMDLRELVLFAGLHPEITETRIQGVIETLDVRFGSLWTNISRKDFHTLNVHDGEDLDVSVYNGRTRVYHSFVPFQRTFADVEIGEPLLYINSLDYVGLALNQGNFSKAYNIGTRKPWYIVLERIPKSKQPE